MNFRIFLPLALVVLLVLLFLCSLIYFNRKNITEDWDKFTELLSKINPLSWIWLLGYSGFGIVLSSFIGKTGVRVNQDDLSAKFGFAFKVFLSFSLILLSLYSLSGEKWEHKYSSGNDMMAPSDKYDGYILMTTPNVILCLVTLIGFILAFRTGSAGWALLAMIQFVILSFISFNLPQFIDDQGWRYGLILGVLTVKWILTTFIMMKI